MAFSNPLAAYVGPPTVTSGPGFAGRVRERQQQLQTPYSPDDIADAILARLGRHTSSTTGTSGVTGAGPAAPPPIVSQPTRPPGSLGGDSTILHRQATGAYPEGPNNPILINAQRAQAAATAAAAAAEKPNVGTQGGTLYAGQSAGREIINNSIMKSQDPPNAIGAMQSRYGGVDFGRIPNPTQADYPQPGQFHDDPTHTPVGPRGPDKVSGQYNTPTGGVVVDANGRKIRDVPGEPTQSRVPVMGPQQHGGPVLEVGKTGHYSPSSDTPFIEVHRAGAAPRSDAEQADVIARRNDYARQQADKSTQLYQQYLASIAPPPAPAAPPGPPVPPSVQVARIHQQTTQQQIDASNTRAGNTNALNVRKFEASTQPKPAPTKSEQERIDEIAKQIFANRADLDMTYTDAQIQAEQAVEAEKERRAVRAKKPSGVGGDPGNPNNSTTPSRGALMGRTAQPSRPGPTTQPAPVNEHAKADAAAQGFRYNPDGTATMPDGRTVEWDDKNVGWRVRR